MPAKTLKWLEGRGDDMDTEYILSAPRKSGYERQFDTLEGTRQAAADLLEVLISDMVEVVSPDGGTTYCYVTQEDADADQDGAYAVQYVEVAGAR